MKNRFYIIVLFLYFFPFCCRLWSSEPGIQTFSFHYNNETLRTALKHLSDKYGINFIFDDVLVDDIAVTCQVVNEAPIAALKKLLRPCKLSSEFLNHNTIIIHRNLEPVKSYRLLKGRVSDSETGLPLEHANAYIQDKNIGSATDLNGNFSFTIPDSTMQLVVSYIGYDAEILRITPESNMLDIKLHPRPFQFNSIIVTAPSIPEEVKQESRTQLSEEYFIGVVPVISTAMTYASFMQYNDNDIYLNSNNSDNPFYIKITGNRLYPMIGPDRNNNLAFKQHQVKLNGFSLQMPYHTTFVPGMNQGIVNCDIIQNNNYNTMVFDVEYADAYESVMELDYRKGNLNRIAGKAMIDLVNAGLMLEGPLTSTSSWIITGKKSYNNDLLDPDFKSKWMSYGYYDFQAQLDFQPADQHNIRFNYIYSTDHTSYDPRVKYIRERMMNNSTNSLPSQGMIRAEEHIEETNFAINRFSLTGISAYDTYRISNKWKSEFTISYSEQSYLNNWAWSVEHEIQIPEVTDSTYNYLWSEGKDDHFRIKSWDEKLIVHFNASPSYSMKAGVHFNQLWYNARMKNNLLVRIEKNVSEPPNYNRAFMNAEIINLYSFFYQSEQHLFDKIKIQTGIRYDHFDLQPNGRLNPRIMINYDFPLQTRMKLAFGTFSRLPEFGEMQQYMLAQFEPGYKSDDSNIEFQDTHKYMIGIEKTFSKYVLLAFNYFFKDMKNIIPIQRLSDGSLLYDTKKGDNALSRGFDVQARFNFSILSLMCQYKFTDSFEHGADNQNYTFYADQWHSLFLSLNTTLPHDWYIGLQAIYGSGYAYTPCVLPEFDWELGYDRDSTPMWEYQTDNPNSARYPGYSRLDITFRKGFILPIGKITMCLDLINLLNTKHTLSYIYTYDQNGEPIRHSESLMPFFPQVGITYEI
jgi:outer membrane receptor protein involved in Fe transport